MHRAGVLFVLLMAASPAWGQGAPLLASDQLDNLVAPIALYPDPLLGQVLAASTYPVEVVEAEQWLGQNSQLAGAPLMEAARQQNWDASVQALVALPNVLDMLANNMQWTSNLGNAFEAQQADVMAAVQRMRARAKLNGFLLTNQQQVVTTEDQNGQSAIEIQPASAQEVAVPAYQPDYVYGAPDSGAYPDLWYPPDYDYDYGFEPPVFMDAFYPGWLGWGGWGWGCGWFTGGLFFNAGFFNHWGFHHGFGGHGFGGRGFGGRGFGGQGYGNPGFGRNAFAGNGAANHVAEGGWRHFNGTGGYQNGTAGYQRAGAGLGWRGFSGRGYAAPARTYGANGGYHAYTPAYRGAPAYTRSYAAPRSYGAPRTYAAPRSYTAPRAFSAPRSFGTPRSFSAPGSSGGHFGFSGGHSAFSGAHGGFSGGHAGGGGGRR